MSENRKTLNCCTIENCCNGETLEQQEACCASDNCCEWKINEKS